MEPHIQYAKTKDGVSIAYWTLGEGMPLVWMPMPIMSNVQLDLQVSAIGGLFGRLARGRKLIRYDCRAAGLSDRSITDYSLEGLVLDLEAVVDRVGLERFALFAPARSGMVGISYTIKHPDRVSHLLLWNASTTDTWGSRALSATRALIDQDWELFTHTYVNFLIGWSEGREAGQAAAYMQASTSPEAVLAFDAAFESVDVTDLLSKVKAPTLVLHPSGDRFVDLAGARDLAAGIPDAHLAFVEGGLFDKASLRAIDEFLGEGEEETAALPEGMAVILFLDIANSTALTEQLGDATFREKARDLDASLRAIIGESGGTPVEGKVLGDGVLAVFASARQAIDCALRCNANSEPPELQLHLGIHAGDVIREGNNVYGGAVNIAARIAGASAPGEVLVSDTVRSLARTSAGVAFDDRGEHELRGVADPQRLFAVRGQANG